MYFSNLFIHSHKGGLIIRSMFKPPLWECINKWEFVGINKCLSVKFCWDLSNVISGGNWLFWWDCVFSGGTLYPSANYVDYYKQVSKATTQRICCLLCQKKNELKIIWNWFFLKTRTWNFLKSFTIYQCHQSKGQNMGTSCCIYLFVL